MIYNPLHFTIFIIKKYEGWESGGLNFFLTTNKEFIKS